jgi:hypothetical protein
MIGRIGLGAKCSKSLMAIHFCDNPGVTAAIKAFLQVKLRAVRQPEPRTDISNYIIEGVELRDVVKE